MEKASLKHHEIRWKGERVVPKGELLIEITKQSIHVWEPNKKEKLKCHSTCKYLRIHLKPKE